MCSSRLSSHGKRVIVTVPDAFTETGHVFGVVGNTGTFGIRHADWVLRLAGRVDAPSKYEAVTVRAAESALIESLRQQQIHPSLIEKP